MRQFGRHVKARGRLNKRTLGGRAARATLGKRSLRIHSHQQRSCRDALTPAHMSAVATNVLAKAQALRRGSNTSERVARTGADHYVLCHRQSTPGDVSHARRSRQTETRSAPESDALRICRIPHFTQPRATVAGWWHDVSPKSRAAERQVFGGRRGSSATVYAGGGPLSAGIYKSSNLAFIERSCL
jgi:hypothetical protein